MPKGVKMSLGHTKEVTVFNCGTGKEETYKIPKLPIRRSVELSIAFKNLFKTADIFKDDEQLAKVFSPSAENQVSEAEMVSVIADILPRLVEGGLEALIDVVAIGSSLDRDTIAELGFDDVTALVEAILDVNHIDKVKANVKNAMSLLGVEQKNLPKVTIPKTSPEVSTD